MNKIHKLPEELIRLIAAGEVVERPSSVVKELVENSLDAGATNIAIEIWASGRARIRVSDNGEGMTPQDADAALDRHATSKLREFDDLQKILTFGFRGEALPSIAAVSRLELTTRTAQAAEAWKISLEGGRVLSAGAAGAPQGTTIDVRDLFFNTPARSKFLKKDSTERSQILRTIQEAAMAHPRVAFQVTMDGKGVMALPGVAHLRERLADLWGRSIVDKIIPLQFAHGAISVEGFVNNVPGHHSTKAYQYLYINERPVQQRLLAHAIYEAYHEWLPVGRHPVYSLFIHLDPAMVDVNVHPTKREVRFASERPIYEMLFGKIRELFGNRVDVPVVQSIGRVGSFPSSNPAPLDFYRPAADFSGSRPLSALELTAAFDFQRPFGEGTSSVADALSVRDSTPRLDPGVRILGQFHRLYLLAEQGEDLILVDQHAAAERVLYERLLTRSTGHPRTSQGLLTPFLWELPADDAELIRSAGPALNEMGFVFEPFGANTFALKAVPATFPELKGVQRFLDLFLDSLRLEGSGNDHPANHEAVASAACRAAIKANDYIAPQEMDGLLRDLALCERPMTCPHGRPTHIRLPLAELHRRFRRT